MEALLPYFNGGCQQADMLPVVMTTSRFSVQHFQIRGSNSVAFVVESNLETIQQFGYRFRTQLAPWPAACDMRSYTAQLMKLLNYQTPHQRSRIGSSTVRIAWHGIHLY